MIYFPFNSEEIVNPSDPSDIEYDRAVDSEVLAQYFKTYFTNGIHPTISNCFKVRAGTGMNIIASPGDAVINGIFCHEDSERTLAVQASESLDRIDTVVLRLDKQDRIIDLYIVKGTASASPQAPTLTRAGDIYELGIANIFVPKLTVEIKDDRITDTRLDTSRCGLISFTGTKVDTTSIFNQLQAALDAYLELVDSAIDGTTAGNLQSQINELKEVREITLTTTWSGDDDNGYSQVLTVEGITESDKPLFDVKLVEGDKAGNEQKREEYNKITDCWTHEGNVTFYASEQTTIELTLIMKGV